MDDYLRPSNAKLVVPPELAGEIHHCAVSAARGLLGMRAWGYTSIWGMRSYSDAAGLPEKTDPKSVEANAKLEQLSDENLELVLDLAALAATAQKFGPPDAEVPDSSITVEMLGGYVEPLDLTEALDDPRELVHQTADRMADYLREWMEPLRDLVIVLRKLKDPALDDFTERCASLVRRTFKNPGI